MKKYIKFFGLAAAATLSLTGCLEETIPTDQILQESLVSADNFYELIGKSVTAQAKSFNILGRTFHYDYSIASMMRIRDIMCADMPVPLASGYNQYSSWEENTYQGDSYVSTQVVWNTYYRMILAANTALDALDAANSDDASLKAFRGQNLAWRAACYLDLAAMYEFLENDATSAINADGNNVLGLTVPITTQATTEADSHNNPRVNHAEMFNFIMKDLSDAETLLAGATRTDMEMPDLAVVYGLKARTYMWNENYEEAARYAELAIKTSGCTPLTRSQWLSTTAGFNSFDNESWMWGIEYVKENRTVTTGICNWTSFTANETTFGYTSVCPNYISTELYDEMGINDFRKLSYKAPEGSPLAGKEPYINKELYDGLGEYAALKFRPGQGSIGDYAVAACSAVPLMRVEEMYLIQAEATAHSAAADGAALLERFVRNYRDPDFAINASDSESVIDECFLQKRIELWGEGRIFYDYKRLNKPVVRAFAGSNWDRIYRFNTATRPAWMNFVIPRTEIQNNPAIKGFNNPDPSEKYKPIG